MERYENIKDLRDGSLYKIRFQTPNICPECRHGIEPFFIGGCVNGKELTVQYYCNACNHSFISRYSYIPASKHSTFVESLPRSINTRDFPVEIQQLSPNFCKIYNQASAAESMGLDEICGLGYRKSLEFLVKDFCILKHPEDEESIKNDHRVDHVIQKYLSDHPLIHDISRVSFWFGNDETHYTRKYDSDNLDNLKKYIEAIIHSLQTELIYGDAHDRLIQKYGNH